MRACCRAKIPKFAGLRHDKVDAPRELIEAPPMIGCRDELSMRVKTYVEAQLADPGLSVERQRRLIRCADALRDPSRAHLSTTDVCFSYGFSSSSHFSRLFKDRFGAGSLSRRAGLPPASDPGLALVRRGFLRHCWFGRAASAWLHGWLRPLRDAATKPSARPRHRRQSAPGGRDPARDRSCRRTEPVLAQKPKQTP